MNLNGRATFWSLVATILGIIVIGTTAIRWAVLADETATDAETIAIKNDARLDEVEDRLIRIESAVTDIADDVVEVSSEVGQIRIDQITGNKLTQYQSQRIDRLLDKLEQE